MSKSHNLILEGWVGNLTDTLYQFVASVVIEKKNSLLCLYILFFFKVDTTQLAALYRAVSMTLLPEQQINTVKQSERDF